jgi:hypothetical protein
MRGLPTVERSRQFRTRRFDAVVLGGALPGLIAAIRLGMSGARVLVVEERAARDAFPGIRDPFLVTGGDSGSVLGQCLRDLGIPLIERQRIGSDPLAFQVVFPDARIDMGERRRVCSELVTWGFASPSTATSLVRGLSDAAAAEREAMLEASVVRAPRRLSRRGQRAAPIGGSAAGGAHSRHARGLPIEVTEAPADLMGLCAAQIRALSNLGDAAPTPEALARLLGLGLEGSATFAGSECWLREMLRERIRALHGEFRSLTGPFQLVVVSNHAGVSLGETGEIWCGRALLINAPRPALAEVVDQDPIPDLLKASPPSRRRVTVHLRSPRSLLPQGMARRVILVRNPNRPFDGTNVIRLRAFPSTQRSDTVDLVASSVVDASEGDLRSREAEIEAGVSELMPFAIGRIEREHAPAPEWDCDDWLGDPPANGGWPAACDVQLSSRPATYALDRAGVGGLGFEGDIMLGWRGGDVVAAEIA